MNENNPSVKSLAPKRKPRDSFLDSRVYALVELLLIVLNALPAGAARRLGRAAGRLLWRLDRRHRKQVLRHMDIAFRNKKTRGEKEELCRRYFKHNGLPVVEFAQLPKIPQIQPRPSRYVQNS